jgi:cellulose synthase/poly-beta-1,6-N-acetylglucosamine synthase-like glycosyltransferase
LHLIILITSLALAILATFTAVPAIVLLIEVLAAMARPQRNEPLRVVPTLPRRLAVIVPAHNEGSELIPTLRDVKAQLRVGDRLLVVADNCSDDTAAIAAAEGAEVVERRDQTRIGKGYALDWGLQHLSQDPPDVVIVIDADCRATADAIRQLANTCATTGQPVQALYLMTAPPTSGIGHQVAEFAFRLKNWMRPLGLQALGLPCQLTGTGMAFPWQVIRSVNLGSGSITEDLTLGLDLAAAGHGPLFCQSARFNSVFPETRRGTDTQRQRWEQGHISTILQTAPRLIWAALAHRNLGLLALAIDVAVPPLALLGALLISILSLSAFVALLTGAVAALIISTLGIVAFAVAGFLAWLQHGRDVLPVRAFVLVPRYILWKLGIYGTIASRRGPQQWIRTDRSKAP